MLNYKKNHRVLHFANVKVEERKRPQGSEYLLLRKRLRFPQYNDVGYYLGTFYDNHK